MQEGTKPNGNNFQASIWPNQLQMIVFSCPSALCVHMWGFIHSLKFTPWSIKPYWSDGMENGWSGVSQKASLNPKPSFFLMLSYSIPSSVNSNRTSLRIIFASSLFFLPFFFFSLGSASPVISPDLPALVVNTGDPVTLHCSGDSKVEWKSRKDTFSNHTSSTLSIPKATYRDTGTYKCAYLNSSDNGIATVHLFVRGNHVSLFPPVLAERLPFREHSRYTGPLWFCVCLGEQNRLLVGQWLTHNHVSPCKIGSVAEALG